MAASGQICCLLYLPNMVGLDIIVTMKPMGYNVRKVDVTELSQEQLLDVVQKLLQRLKLDVWVDETPDYTEITLQDWE